MEKILVAGAGISGQNAAKLLLAIDEEVVLYDGDASKDKEALRALFEKEDRIEIVLGELPAEILREVRERVVSPGIPMDAPVVDTVISKGIEVISEIELAYQVDKGRVAAITGTNGKTTTTALLGQIMKNEFRDVFVVGNIGRAYTSEAGNTNHDSVTVAEVSSFQLETVKDFRPHVSAILNITPDHLNRHRTMERYCAAKLHVAMNQKKDDFCILNARDEWLQEYAPHCPARVLWFDSERELEEGAFCRDDIIWLRLDGIDEAVINIHDMQILGKHNVENAMAAILMAVAMGVSLDNVRKGLREFQAVEHRIERVVEKNGVIWYNDSKGTNPDAAIQAIKAMERPTVLLGGGYDKGGSFDEWIESCTGKVKHLILMGATAEKIRETALRYGITDITMVDSLEEAVNVAADVSVPGDAVLLSPACASWGMFPNYEVRGRLFKELVKAL